MNVYKQTDRAFHVTMPTRWVAFGVVLLAAMTVSPPLHALTRIELAEEPTHTISPYLFGQFMERTAMRSSRAEFGPEAALIPGTSELQPGVVEELLKLHAPIIRFPGGSVVGRQYDWTVLIDNSPYREDPARPEHHLFGLDEMMELCAELDAEPLVAVNFRAAVWDARPEELPALPEELAAGLVAYCNLPVGSTLPEGMPDWPALRARNGHPDPYNIRYFQIGNEWVQWLGATDAVQEQLGKPPFGSDEALVEHVITRLLDMVNAMKAVDPDIKIIIDAVMWEKAHEPWFDQLLADDRVKDIADFATVHLYRPWAVSSFEKNDTPIDGDNLTPEEIWYAVVGAPDIGAEGFSVMDDEAWTLARKHGWPITLTEWNWNGWGVERQGGTLWPRALGVAGFLHAFLRESEHIHIATQSMMLGDRWIINGVRVDSEREHDPFILPSGRMTGFYSQYHGNRYLPVKVDDPPMTHQPVRMGSLKPVPHLALVDTVATEDDQAVYVHLINRDKDQAHAVEIDPGTRTFARSARLYQMEGGRWNPQEELFVSPGQYEETESEIELTSGSFLLKLPTASVTILKLFKED